MKNNGPNGNHKNYILFVLSKNVSKKQRKKKNLIFMEIFYFLRT